jgi:alpha-tubulin suppressor-like RCC1 family protein
MKNVALIVTSAVIFASVAAAIPAKAYACYCEARSPYAWGWGQHGSCARAQQIALTQCAVRTPRGNYCYVTFCN